MNVRRNDLFIQRAFGNPVNVIVYYYESTDSHCADCVAYCRAVSVSLYSLGDGRLSLFCAGAESVAGLIVPCPARAFSNLLHFSTNVVKVSHELCTSYKVSHFVRTNIDGIESDISKHASNMEYTQKPLLCFGFSLIDCSQLTLVEISKCCVAIVELGRVGLEMCEEIMEMAVVGHFEVAWCDIER